MWGREGGGKRERYGETNVRISHKKKKNHFASPRFNRNTSSATSPGVGHERDGQEERLPTPRQRHKRAERPFPSQPRSASGKEKKTRRRPRRLCPCKPPLIAGGSQLGEPHVLAAKARTRGKVAPTTRASPRRPQNLEAEKKTKPARERSPAFNSGCQHTSPRGLTHRSRVPVVIAAPKALASQPRAPQDHVVFHAPPQKIPSPGTHLQPRANPPPVALIQSSPSHGEEPRVARSGPAPGKPSRQNEPIFPQKKKKKSA